MPIHKKKNLNTSHKGIIRTQALFSFGFYNDKSYLGKNKFEHMGI